MKKAQKDFACRTILLGASNLTRSLSTVIETCWNRIGYPQEIYAALGHGRSFGMDSSVLGRRLPGILQSGLWDALDDACRLPTYALVTDIGNDLLYGAPVATISDWIDECLVRLQAKGIKGVVTALPIANLETLGQARFKWICRLFFPSCQLTLTEVTQRAISLDQKVAQIAEKRGFSIVSQAVDWYGWDPIHIRRRWFARAWNQILTTWNPAISSRCNAVGSLRRWFYLQTRWPQRQHWFGRLMNRSQPVAELEDGSELSLF